MQLAPVGETVQNLGGCYGKARSQQTGGEMRWRVLVELAGANGAVEVHEVGVGERPPAGQQRKAPQVLDGLIPRTTVE